MDISDDEDQKNPLLCDFLTLVRRPQLMQLLETSVAESEAFLSYLSHLLNLVKTAGLL